MVLGRGEWKAVWAQGAPEGAECHLVVVLADGTEECHPWEPVCLGTISGIYKLAFVGQLLCVSYCTACFACTFSLQPLVKEVLLSPIYRGRN